MSRPDLARRTLLATLLAAVVAGCGDSGTAGPVGAPQHSLLAPLSFVACLTAEELTATDTILPDVGGTVAVGRTSITVPPGAVLEPTAITLTIPASAIAEVRITANGKEHLTFQRPVSVTIDYGHCGGLTLGLLPVSVWYIDEVTRQLLEYMGGVDDKHSRTITFSTGHLSGYAILN
jgi:hypothetical protein